MTPAWFLPFVLILAGWAVIGVRLAAAYHATLPPELRACARRDQPCKTNFDPGSAFADYDSDPGGVGDYPTAVNTGRL